MPRTNRDSLPVIWSHNRRLQQRDAVLDTVSPFGQAVPQQSTKMKGLVPRRRPCTADVSNGGVAGTRAAGDSHGPHLPRKLDPLLELRVRRGGDIALNAGEGGMGMGREGRTERRCSGGADPKPKWAWLTVNEELDQVAARLRSLVPFCPSTRHRHNRAHMRPAVAPLHPVAFDRERSASGPSGSPSHPQKGALTVTLQPPSVTLQPPSVTLHPPSVGVQPQSVTPQRRRVAVHDACP